MWQLRGEAVLLDANGISDFNALHSRKRDDEVQLYASTFWPPTATTSAGCRCRYARPIWPASWPGGSTAFTSRRSSRARSGRIYSGTPASSASKGWSPSTVTAPTAAAGSIAGSR